MNAPFPAGSVDDTVYRLIYNWPSLFENRTQALMSMFLTIGAGWHWSEGRLVCGDPEAFVPRSDEDVVYELHPMYAVKPDYMTEDQYEAELARHAARNEEILAIRADAVRLATTPGPFACRSRLMDTPYFKVPANVTAEWAAARDEVRRDVVPAWKRGEHKPKLVPLETRERIAESIKAAAAARKAGLKAAALAEKATKRAAR